MIRSKRVRQAWSFTPLAIQVQAFWAKETGKRLDQARQDRKPVVELTNKELAVKLDTYENTVYRIRKNFEEVGLAIHWADHQLEHSHYRDVKSRMILPMEKRSEMAHKRKSLRLLDGHWDYEKGALKPGYHLGEDHEILVDDGRSRELVDALRSIADGNNTFAGAARVYKFKVEFLRGVPKEPYFYQGLVKIPITLADELEARGEAKFPKRIPARDGKSVWVQGKHRPIPTDQLLRQISRRPQSIIRTPKEKIEAMFDLWNHKHLPLTQIEAELGVPMQTVYTLLHNSDCSRIVGEKEWKLAQTPRIGPKNNSSDD